VQGIRKEPRRKDHGDITRPCCLSIFQYQAKEKRKTFQSLTFCPLDKSSGSLFLGLRQNPLSSKELDYCALVKAILSYTLALFVVFFCSTAFAATCKEQLPDAYKINLESIGTTIYVGDFPEIEDVNKGPYALTGGVCIENASGVQLVTVAANVTITDNSPNIEAEDVQVLFEDYELTAKTLKTNGQDLQLTNVVFTGTTLAGVAKEANYNFATQEIELFESSVRGQAVSIESKRAVLRGDEASFEELTATTCQCSGDPFYKVRAERADFNLTTQTLIVNEGTLELTGLRLAFNEVTVSPETLRDFRFPVTIEYVAGDIKDGATGLGIKVPALRLDDTLTLELGLVGLDDAYPLAGVFVVHFKDGTTTADVGLTPFGFQADFNITQPLTPWLGLSFGVNNRHWVKADFLHESYLSLDANTAINVLGNDSLALSGQVLVAGSSQDLPVNPILDARLALNSNATYQAPALPFGQFGVSAQTRFSYYPIANRVQWGVKLVPRWQYTLGPASFDILYSRQWTNAASPFSTKLDRLEPESKLFVNTKIAGPLASNLQGEFNFSVSYNFLDITRYVGEGFASLATSAKLTYQVNDLSVVPSFGIEFAPLMNPDLDNNFRPLIKGGLDIIAPRWEAGFEVNYDMELAKLSKLETRGSFTIDLGDVSLEPFLALNVLPTLIDSTWPQLSGHGLEVQWRTCCGTLNVGYRQFNNTFSTAFSVSLEQRLEVTVEQP
jgi:LptA/(LptD N-terminal domain) LPS transport protein